MRAEKLTFVIIKWLNNKTGSDSSQTNKQTLQLYCRMIEQVTSAMREEVSDSDGTKLGDGMCHLTLTHPSEMSIC